jgi:hypothetical protein
MVENRIEDRIRGNRFRWSFADGPMAGRAFEHTFGEDGAVTFRPMDGQGKATRVQDYRTAAVTENVAAVSYCARGYTLTTLLDFSDGTLTAFASNDQGVTLQRGRFEREPAT